MNGEHSESSLFTRLANARHGAAHCLPTGDDRAAFPLLFEFMTRVDVSASLEKDLASVTIRLGLGEWTVDLSDPGFEVSISATAQSLSGALAALEAELRSPTPNIKPWRGAKGKLRSKKVKKDAAD